MNVAIARVHASIFKKRVRDVDQLKFTTTARLINRKALVRRLHSGRAFAGAARSQSTIGVQKMAPQIRVGVHVCRKPIVAIVSVETDESIEIPLSLLYSIDARI